MAIITLASPVSGIRGTVGGITYSANASGPYVRSWSKGANPRTASQSSQRATLAQFAQNWKNLTSGQRDDWNDYGAASAQEKFNALGESYYASGFAWYVAINSNLAIAGLSARDDAPTNSVPPAPSIFAFVFKTDAASSATRIGLSGALPNPTDMLYVRARVYNSSGRIVASKPRQFVVAEVPDGMNRLFFQSDWQSKFGEIQDGQTGFVDVYVMDDQGRWGPPESESAIADST